MGHPLCHTDSIESKRHNSEALNASASKDELV